LKILVSLVWRYIKKKEECKNHRQWRLGRRL